MDSSGSSKSTERSETRYRFGTIIDFLIGFLIFVEPHDVGIILDFADGFHNARMEPCVFGITFHVLTLVS